MGLRLFYFDEAIYQNYYLYISKKEVAPNLLFCVSLTLEMFLLLETKDMLQR